jgi:hypothetical protein
MIGSYIRQQGFLVVQVLDYGTQLVLDLTVLLVEGIEFIIESVIFIDGSGINETNPVPAKYPPEKTKGLDVFKEGT